MLRYASRNGFVDIVKLLLKDARVNPEDARNSALIHAVTERQAKVVKCWICYSIALALY